MKLSKEDISRVEVTVGSVEFVSDLFSIIAWPIVGMFKAQAAVRSGESRLESARSYATLLTVWVLTAGLCAASTLAV